jgi:DNA-directed RNA polymerase subunit L
LDLGIVLIEKGKNHIEVELSEPVGNVLLEPLKERLLADDSVDLATHDSDHPMYGKRRLFVRVRSGKPQNAVKRALKDLGAEFDAARKATEKAKAEPGKKAKPAKKSTKSSKAKPAKKSAKATKAKSTKAKSTKAKPAKKPSKSKK